MNAQQLREAIAEWPDETPVAVRTLEHGEICLTVALTSVDQYDEGAGVASLLLVGDIDQAAS